MIVDINYRDDDYEERRVYLSNGIRNVSRLISMAGGQSQALSSVLFLFLVVPSRRSYKMVLDANAISKFFFF